MTFVFIERQIIDWYIAYVNPDDDHWLVFRTIFLSRVCNFDVLLRFFFARYSKQHESHLAFLHRVSIRVRQKDTARTKKKNIVTIVCVCVYA